MSGKAGIGYLCNRRRFHPKWVRGSKRTVGKFQILRRGHLVTLDGL